MTAAAVEVRRSKIQGRGVFAKRAIKAGTKILEYTGERISHKEAEARYDDVEMERHHTFLFTVDRHIVIDAVKKGGPAKYINHSCDGNCVAEIADGRVWIWSIKDIAPGEELYYDYYYSTDPSYTMADLKRLYPCWCGSPKCRGTIAAPRRKKKKKPAAKKATKTKKAAPKTKKTLKTRGPAKKRRAA